MYSLGIVNWCFIALYSYTFAGWTDTFESFLACGEKGVGSECSDDPDYEWLMIDVSAKISR